MQTRLLCALLVSLLPFAASAGAQQQLLDEDRIRIRAYVDPDQRYYVGQQVRFFVEILADTWFTTAPRYPEVRVPGAVAIDPERFSTNLTIREGARTLTGQRHGYLIYPQRVGKLTIPAVSVSFAVSVDAKASELITLKTQPVSISAVMPPGVEDAIGLITGRNVSISETYEPRGAELKVGDSIIRTVTISADDVQALVLPPTQFADVEGLANYPGEPQLSNSTNRGQYSGKRVDTVTYIVEREGDYTLPKVEYQWFDPTARRLRKTVLPAREFSALPDPDAVTGTATEALTESAAADYEQWVRKTLDWLESNLQPLSLGVGALYLLSLLNRRYRRTLLQAWRARQKSGAAQEAQAFARLEAACRRGNAQQISREVWSWMAVAGYSTSELARVSRSIGASDEFVDAWQHLNEALYKAGQSSKTVDTRTLLSGLRHLRRSLQGKQNKNSALHEPVLGPLNP